MASWDALFNSHIPLVCARCGKPVNTVYHIRYAKEGNVCEECMHRILYPKSKRGKKK